MSIYVLLLLPLSVYIYSYSSIMNQMASKKIFCSQIWKEMNCCIRFLSLNGQVQERATAVKCVVCL